MSCNLKIVTSLTRDQVRMFVKDNRLVGCSDCSTEEEPVLDYISNFMKQMTGYSVVPIPCVSRIGGKEASLDLGVDCYMPMLPIRSGNFLLQLQTCNDSACSIELDDYLRFAEDFKRTSDADDLEYLSEELYDTMQLGGIPNGENVVSFVPFIDGASLKCFTELERDWSQKNQSIEYGVDAIKVKVMNLL